MRKRHVILLVVGPYLFLAAIFAAINFRSIVSRWKASQILQHPSSLSSFLAAREDAFFQETLDSFLSSPRGARLFLEQYMNLIESVSAVELTKEIFDKFWSPTLDTHTRIICPNALVWHEETGNISFAILQPRAIERIAPQISDYTAVLDQLLETSVQIQSPSRLTLTVTKRDSLPPAQLAFLSLAHKDNASPPNVVVVVRRAESKTVD